jgi:hypothetical protein
LERRFIELSLRAPVALAEAVYAEANAIMATSLRLCPIDTGALRSSGHVELPKIEGRGVTVEMGYGGAAAPYALIVHERMGVFHQPPTQAKYLEQPFLEASKGMADRLGHLMRASLRLSGA